jgi:hypothetical protein
MDGGLFDPKRPSATNILTNEHYIVNAIEILEDLAAAYVRDVTPSVRSEIRCNQRRFDVQYEMMEKDFYLKNLSSCLELEFRHFEEWFKTVADDMDSQVCIPAETCYCHNPDGLCTKLGPSMKEECRIWMPHIL